jgi:hypothetical protein
MTRSRDISLLAAIAILAFSVGSGTSDASPVLGPHPILSKTSARVSAAVGHDYFVHVWSAPSSTGGLCHFNTLDHHPAAQRPSSWPTSGGGSCSATSPPNTTTHLRSFRYVSIDIALTNAEHSVPTNVEGELVTTISPTRLIAKWYGGSHELTLHHHYFAGGSPAMYGQTSTLTLIAYDRHGHTIAHWHNQP